MLGFFDKNIVKEGWFAPEIQPLGWFDVVLLDTVSGGSTYELGQSTIGATPLSGITDSTTLGSRYTASQSGTISSIKVYTNIGASGTAGLRVAIFSNGGGDTIGSLIASSIEVSVTNTSPQWIDVPISASVTGGNDYWLFAWGDASGFSSDFTYYADANSDPNSIVISFGNSYPTWSTVGDGIDENYDLANMSIYAVVTVAGGGSGAIDGSASGVGSVSGTIQAKGKLSGAINGVATTSATISRRVSISGVSNGIASTTAILRGKIKAIGQSNGVATTSGTLTPRTYIIGTSSGVASVSGIIKGKARAIGVINGTSTATAIIKGKGRLSGLSTATSTATAIGKAKGKLIGVANGTSTASVNLNSRIFGTINGTSTVSGTIKGRGYIQSVSNGVASVSGSIKAKGRLVGFTDGISNLSATIKAYVSVSGSVTSQANVNGLIIGRVNISGNINSTSTATGILIESNAGLGSSDFIIRELTLNQSNFIIANPIKESNFVIDYQMNQANFTIKTPVVGESNFIIWQP